MGNISARKNLERSKMPEVGKLYRYYADSIYDLPVLVLKVWFEFSYGFCMLALTKEGAVGSYYLLDKERWHKYGV